MLDLATFESVFFDLEVTNVSLLWRIEFFSVFPGLLDKVNCVCSRIEGLVLEKLVVVVLVLGRLLSVLELSTTPLVVDVVLVLVVLQERSLHVICLTTSQPLVILDIRKVEILGVMPTSLCKAQHYTYRAL